MSGQSRRNILKSIAAGGAAIAGKTLPKSWYTPVVNSVLLPVHAQTSCSTIQVTSPFRANGSISRAIVITDDADNVLARCCCGETSDIVIETGCLPAGTYRVFGDSDGPLDHTVYITTVAGTVTVTVPTSDNGDRGLMATVVLPEGTVQQESGQLVGAPKEGPTLGCLQGGA